MRVWGRDRERTELSLLHLREDFHDRSRHDIDVTAQQRVERRRAALIRHRRRRSLLSTLNTYSLAMRADDRRSRS